MPPGVNSGACLSSKARRWAVFPGSVRGYWRKKGVTQVEDPFDVLTIGEPLKNCAAINKEYVRTQKSEMKI